MYYRFKNSAKGATWPMVELALVYSDGRDCFPIYSMGTDGYEALLADYPVPSNKGELMWSLYGWAPGKGVDCFSDTEVDTHDWDREAHGSPVLAALARALEVLHGLGITELVDERGIDMDVQDQRGPVYVDVAKMLEALTDGMGRSDDDLAVEMYQAHFAEEDEDDMNSDSDAECPVCHGPGILMGALGKVSHYRCRDCGNGFYHKA